MRLLRSTLNLAPGPLDAETIVAANALAGLPPAATLTKQHLHQVLHARVGMAPTRTAVWLDDGTWYDGTTPAQRAETVAALLDRAQLDVVVLRAANALHPYPTRPSEFRRATGDAEPVDTAHEQREAAKVVLAMALRVKVEVGTWPPNITAVQQAVLTAQLVGLDVQGIGR